MTLSIQTHKFEYSERLKEFVKSLSQNAGFVSRTGTLNQYGIKFTALLEECDLSHLRGETLNDIRHLIRHEISNHVCLECNENLRGSKLINLTPYCSMACRSKSKVFKSSISKTKRLQYSDPIRKEEIEQKKRQTCLENHGVEYPMQCPEIFEKNMKSSRQAYSHRGLSGLRGYEKYIVDWLMDVHGLVPEKHFIAGSTARKTFKQNIFVGGGHRFPDIYVIPWNTYIEVKSSYTLSLFDILPDMKEAVEDLGSDYICLVYTGVDIKQVNIYTKDLIPLEKTYANYAKVSNFIIN